MLSRHLLKATVAAAALLLAPNLARADSTVAAMTAASALTGPELFYCVQTAADHNCTATQLKTFVTASGVVTSVGFSVPATSIFTATGSPVTGSGTLGFTTAGTSGGIPYFSSAAALSSSAVLTANLPVIGGGAGVAPTVGSVSGNTTKFATVNTTTFTTGQCVQVDASLNLTTTGSACGAGGGGTPGGSNTQLQYNNSSAFGGITNATTDGTNMTALRLKSTASLDWDNGSGTVDVSLFRDAAGLLAQRVGTAAQTFRVYNTFTDSTHWEAGIFDWQTTPTVLSIGSNQGSAGGTARGVALVKGGNTYLDFDINNSPFVNLGATANGFIPHSGGLQGLGTNSFYWNNIFVSSVTVTSGSTPVVLTIDGANILAQRQGTSAQVHRVYNTFTDASNFERGVIDWTTTGNTLIVGQQFLGTGQARQVNIAAPLHLGYTSGTPTANSCAGFALTTGSSDVAGKVTFTSATSCSITFANAFTNAPFCVVSPGSAASTHDAVTSTTGLAVTFGTANTSMQWHCFGS